MIPPYIDLLGKPWVRGARGPDEFDCYGLVRELSRRNGKIVPDFASPGTVEDIADLISVEERKWRKVPFGTINSIVTLKVEGMGSHVGYVIDRDRHVHCLEHIGVTTDRLTNPLIRPLGFYFYE